MLQSAFRRMKIQACKLVIGKNSMRVVARLGWGAPGVVVYNRCLDLMSTMMGSSKESDKLLKRVRDILVEFMVLSAEKEFDHKTLFESGEKRFDKLLDQIENDFPEISTDTPRPPETKEIVEVRKLFLQQLINGITKLLVEELGEAFEPATIRKLHEVSRQMSQPNVLHELCWIDSPTVAIINELVVLFDKLEPVLDSDIPSLQDLEQNPETRTLSKALQCIGFSDTDE